MFSGNPSFLATMFFTIAFSSTSLADQKIPFGVVDFQQYDTYQQYLQKTAKHKVFVVSEHMQPGSGYGWGDTIEIATRYAKEACKERFRWNCEVVSIDGKIQGKTRSIPDSINQPASIVALSIDTQPEEIKNLFKGYPFTNMYTRHKSHKAYAVNNFGATGQGHGKGYITTDIAKERALFHCNQSATRGKIPVSRQQPCYVVAVNDQLFPANIKKVLEQKELLADIINPGEATEKWHGKYVMDLSKLTTALGVDAGDDIYYLFGNIGFQIKQGDLVMASGTYKQNGDLITLDYVTGEKDPQKRKLLLAKNRQSITFEEKKYAGIVFNKK